MEGVLQGSGATLF